MNIPTGLHRHSLSANACKTETRITTVAVRFRSNMRPLLLEALTHAESVLVPDTAASAVSGEKSLWQAWPNLSRSMFTFPYSTLLFLVRSCCPVLTRGQRPWQPARTEPGLWTVAPSPRPHDRALDPPWHFFCLLCAASPGGVADRSPVLASSITSAASYGPRWRAFVFGLVHGFVRQVLIDLDLPRDPSAVSLLGFNVGGDRSLVVVGSCCRGYTPHGARPWFRPRPVLGSWMSFTGGLVLVGIIQTHAVLAGARRRARRWFG